MDEWLKNSYTWIFIGSLIFICSTLLLIAYIYNKCIDKKGSSINCNECTKQNKKECSNMLKKDKVYLSIIFAIIIIIFSTKALYSDTNFGSQLNFAGTVSSIILSVIAIIMTITGDEKQESTKNSIDRVARIIEQNAEVLGKYVGKINDTDISEIQNSIKQLDSLLKDAINKIEKQGESISEIRKFSAIYDLKGSPIESKSEYKVSNIWSRTTKDEVAASKNDNIDKEV